MTREQLEKNIADNNGEWHKDGFVFTIDSDKTLRVVRGMFTSFLIPEQNRMEEWYLSGGFDLGQTGQFMRTVRELAHALGVDPLIEDRIERAAVHQEAAPVSSEPLYRAEGKVEAYEKILLGRSVTISA